jgi:hypothetical protein
MLLLMVLGTAGMAGAYVLSDVDGDGIYTGSAEFDPSIGQFEYVVAVTGPADGWSGWGFTLS